MKKKSLLIILGITIFFNSGCVTKLTSFEKRKYNKGYHVDFAKNKNKKRSCQDPETLAVITEQKTKNIKAIKSARVILKSENTKLISEKKMISEAPIQLVPSNEKKKNQHTIDKNLINRTIITSVKKGFQDIVSQRNTTDTNKQFYFSPLIVWGIITILLAVAFIGINYYVGTIAIVYITLGVLAFIWGTLMLVQGLLGYDDVFPLW
jgi:hypothetical protein